MQQELIKHDGFGRNVKSEVGKLPTNQVYLFRKINDYF